MNKINHSGGFTLIEVIIAMSLLAIMMLLLFGSMRICVQNWDAGERKMREVGRMAEVQNFFKRHLTAIKPLQNNFTEDEPEFTFQGDKRSLQFVSSLPASAGRFGLQLFSVALKKNEDDNQVIAVSITPFFPAAEGEEWKIEEVIIAEQIETLEISYYGVEKLGNEAEWHEEWENDSVPDLIKVAIELEGGKVWPEIIVEPRISLASAALDRAESDGDE